MNSTRTLAPAVRPSSPLPLAYALITVAFLIQFNNDISEEKKPHPTPDQSKMHKVDWVHDKKKTKKKTTRTLTVG